MHRLKKIFFKKKNPLDQALKKIKEAKKNNSAELDLSSMDIDDEKLEILLPHIKELKGIEKIDLSHNRIHSLKSDSFKGLENLRDLDLGSNIISDIDDNPFSGLPNLQKLDLESNMIRNIGDKAFSLLPNLKTLYLSYNNIVNINENIFINLEKLKHLDLASNKLTSINEKTFHKLPNLKTLDLSYNNIVNINENIFINLEKLKHLDLASNKLTSINEKTFHKLPNLEKLNLSRNDINDIHYNAFKAINSLKELNLSYCKIRALNNRILSRLPVLEEFDMSHNQITNINANIFTDLSSHLRNVNFSHNMINDVEQMLVNRVRDFRLNLGYNPLSQETVTMLAQHGTQNVDFNMARQNNNTDASIVLQDLDDKEATNIATRSPELRDFLSKVGASSYWTNKEIRDEITVPTLRYLFSQLKDPNEKEIAMVGVIGSLGDCGTPVIGCLLNKYLEMKSANEEEPNVGILEKQAVTSAISEKLGNLFTGDPQEYMNGLLDALFVAGSEKNKDNKCAITGKINCSNSNSRYNNAGLSLGFTLVKPEVADKFLKMTCKCNKDGNLIFEKVDGIKCYVRDNDKIKYMVENYMKSLSVKKHDKNDELRNIDPNLVNKAIDNICNAKVYQDLICDHSDDPSVQEMPTSRDDFREALGNYCKSVKGQTDQQKCDGFINFMCQGMEEIMQSINSINSTASATTTVSRLTAEQNRRHRSDSYNRACGGPDS